MISRGDAIVQNAVIGILAIILVGGSVAGYLLGRPIPEWLVGFDGVIVTAAFGSTGFFAVARTAQPSFAALGHMTERYHELASRIAGSVAPMPTGTNETASTTGSQS